MTPEDIELRTLLDLDGQQYRLKHYWIKIEAHTVPRDTHRPQGIKYSLTLHDRNNTRLLGFDNAHAIGAKGRKRGKYNGRIVSWDHVHNMEKVQPYSFSSAAQIIQDFWDRVEAFIK